MNDQSITHFPVGNGDMSLITLADSTTLLVDCNIREPNDEEDILDVHGLLLDTLKRDSKKAPHVNVFILTHPDQDHCRGFKDHFYQGNPAKYTDTDRRAGKVIVDELWFAPRVFNEYNKGLPDDAKAIRTEAERRIELYTSGDPKCKEPGNRLRLIGASDNEELDGLDDIRTIPGQTLNLINGKVYDDFRILILAPIKYDSDGDDTERNDTSIVVQMRFDVDEVEDAVRILLGGDTSCEYWERILDKNDDKALEWDLLLAPHHCSWYFFSTESPTADAKPSKKVMRLLKCRRKGAFVVSSSKPIKDDGDDPPSFKAKQIYVAAVGEDHFLCTGDTPDEPITFIMTGKGPQKSGTASGDGKASLSAMIGRAVSTPRTYG